MPDDSSDDPPLPPSLRLLRRLVMALTVVMIIGFVVLIGAFVIRLRAAPPPLPDSVALPDGTSATAFTQGDDWFAVVTADDRILIYDRDTGTLFQTVTITRP
jgi:hypothetical protein